jgi:hypothetical protein
MVTNRRQFISGVAAATAATLANAASPSGQPQSLLVRSGWDTVNIGDIGHTPGVLRVLEKHLPGIRLTVWLNRTNERIDRMLKRRFPDVEFVQGTVDALAGPKEPALKEAFERASLILQNSGMMTDTRFMSWCNRTGKRWGLYGQSYFPDFVQGKPENIAMLNGAQFIYCRDSITIRTLREAGVQPPVLEFLPDTCFGVDVRDEERGHALMQQHGLRDRHFLTIMLRTNTPKHPERVTNLPLDRNGLTGTPTPAHEAEDRKRAEVYREVIMKWIDATGLPVLIAPEVEKEIPHNRRLLYHPLPEKYKRLVINTDTFWNVDEAISVFARARIVFCHEPHSCILAMGVGTPVVHSYSKDHGWPKAHMFSDLGLPEWLMDFDESTAQSMTDTLLGIHQDHGDALMKARRAMNLVESRWAASVPVIRKAMEG